MVPEQYCDGQLRNVSAKAQERAAEVKTLVKRLSHAIEQANAEVVFQCVTKAVESHLPIAGQDLQKAGFRAEILIEKGFNPVQLKEAGFNPGQLKEAGFNLGQLM